MSSTTNLRNIKGRQINSTFNCWVCNSNKLEIAKSSNIELAKEFTISNSEYGITSEIHRCKECGFLQWSDLKDTLPLFENVQDHSYESVRKERAVCQKKILEIIYKNKSKGRLLDIGAGSGILVEQAIKMGFKAEGIEPSEWFYTKAKEHKVPVHLGMFPHSDLKGPYDIVTLIDVLEHVPEPLKLLSEIPKVLASNGIVVVIVPDVGSLPAKMLGWKWWNFKPGHIGYFNKKTLELIFNNAGFKLINQWYRPSLYYPLSYVLERLNSYIPCFMTIANLPFLKNVIIPLDLKDSIMGFYELKKTES